MSVYSKYSDEELIGLLKANQQKALSALYSRYWDKMLVVALNRLDNLEIAEECVQNVFLSLWKRRHALVLSNAVSTYLAVAVKYQVIKQMDKIYRRKLGDDFIYFLPSESPSADAYVLEKELLEKVAEAVERLPEKCRIVFLMSREDNMTNKQIASDLGVSEKTVEAHITKAIKSLRSDLAMIPPILIHLFL
ncbi:RNA polymerase sigma-70 factor [Sphingobacterium sp. UT-1RO-CII-1]|nr:RNA polymerase sigma-70 factor [Sphingobacterium sp. UT-1RO-CII-1]